MDNRYTSVLLILGVIVLLVLWGIDFRAMLGQQDDTAVGFAGYLAVLAVAVVYAGYLRQKLAALSRRLAGLKQAWREVPCAVAVMKAGKVVEVCGEAELFSRYGLATGDGEAAGRRVETERHVTDDGEERFFERLVVPLPLLNAGSYTAEMLFDVSARVKTARARESEYGKMLKILVNSFEMKDPYCQGHSEAVSNLAHELAGALSLPAAEAETITRAALLHDIGKIIIPPEIINKAGGLSPAEFETIKAHSEVGADILASLEIFQAEAVIVRHHHERWGGGGYPAGLRGEAIPRGARIVAVADAFDAMTAGRSVRGRRDVGTALAVIESEMGHQFDPQVAEAFVGLVRAGRNRR